ncbi:hypothetical protein L3X38_004475 [Prunus dulcis]|uniref:Uncharacterized protein n=1 Tax=Prunus dulcis TaxID=3755 RepID=A0AAD4ZP33_PRUDU|nr:hypothetical protein L3X38_004475 [Prunus dulcis]
MFCISLRKLSLRKSTSVRVSLKGLQACSTSPIGYLWETEEDAADEVVVDIVDRAGGAAENDALVVALCLLKDAAYGQLHDYPASLKKWIGTWIPPSDSMETFFWEIPGTPCVSRRTLLVVALRLP